MRRALDQTRGRGLMEVRHEEGCEIEARDEDGVR